MSGTNQTLASIVCLAEVLLCWKMVCPFEPWNFGYYVYMCVFCSWFMDMWIQNGKLRQTCSLSGRATGASLCVKKLELWACFVPQLPLPLLEEIISCKVRLVIYWWSLTKRIACRAQIGRNCATSDLSPSFANGPDASLQAYLVCKMIFFCRNMILCLSLL